MTSNWLYDAIIYIYILGLLCFFADFLERSLNARRMGTGLLTVVWLLQAGFFFTRMAAKQQVPLITLFEILFFFSWVIVTLALVLLMQFKQEMVMFLLGVLGFLLVMIARFSDTSMFSAQNGWDFSSQLLLLHISLGIASYAVFLISAIFSGMYLFVHSKLKEKRWLATLKRFPSLDRTSVYAYRSVLVGCVLMLGSLAFGIIWLWGKGDLSLLLDPKVLVSMLLLCAYFLYIVQRIRMEVSERRLAYWNLSSCAIIVLNFIASYYFSNLQPWIWM